MAIFVSMQPARPPIAPGHYQFVQRRSDLNILRSIGEEAGPPTRSKHGFQFSRRETVPEMECPPTSGILFDPGPNSTAFRDTSFSFQDPAAKAREMAAMQQRQPIGRWATNVSCPDKPLTAKRIGFKGAQLRRSKTMLSHMSSGERAENQFAKVPLAAGKLTDISTLPGSTPKCHGLESLGKFPQYNWRSYKEVNKDLTAAPDRLYKNTYGTAEWKVRPDFKLRPANCAVHEKMSRLHQRAQSDTALLPARQTLSEKMAVNGALLYDSATRAAGGPGDVSNRRIVDGIWSSEDSEHGPMLQINAPGKQESPRSPRSPITGAEGQTPTESDGLLFSQVKHCIERMKRVQDGQDMLAPMSPADNPLRKEKGRYRPISRTMIRTPPSLSQSSLYQQDKEYKSAQAYMKYLENYQHESEAGSAKSQDYLPAHHPIVSEYMGGNSKIVDSVAEHNRPVAGKHEPSPLDLTISPSRPPTADVPNSLSPRGAKQTTSGVDRTASGGSRGSKTSRAPPETPRVAGLSANKNKVPTNSKPQLDKDTKQRRQTPCANETKIREETLISDNKKDMPNSDTPRRAKLTVDLYIGSAQGDESKDD